MKKAACIVSALVLLLLCSCDNIAVVQANGSPSAKPPAPSVIFPASPPAPASNPASPPPAPASEPPSASPSHSVPVRPGSSPAQSPTPEENSKKTPLNDAELKFFADYFAQMDNDGFLLSNYAEPSGIDLQQLFYFGAGIAMEGDKISKDEANAFMAAYELDSIEGDFMKLTTKQIDNFLKEKMGISLSDVNGKMGWLYLPEYDAYYAEVFDTNYGFFDCVGGYKTGNTYVVECTESPDYSQQVESCTVTLHKSGAHYLFVSNKAKMAY